MATPPSTESKELSLLDKVELKIALADSEAKLQNVLNIYLSPILLKLASEHVSVRNKVCNSEIDVVGSEPENKRSVAPLQSITHAHPFARAIFQRSSSTT